MKFMAGFEGDLGIGSLLLPHLSIQRVMLNGFERTDTDRANIGQQGLKSWPEGKQCNTRLDFRVLARLGFRKFGSNPSHLPHWLAEGNLQDLTTVNPSLEFGREARDLIRQVCE